jgi:hypothetical protein
VLPGVYLLSNFISAEQTSSFIFKLSLKILENTVEINSIFCSFYDVYSLIFDI